jgi:hypothetical protein
VVMAVVLAVVVKGLQLWLRDCGCGN